MSTIYLCNDKRVIDCPIFKDGKPIDWNAFRGLEDNEKKRIKKVVLGQLGNDGKKDPLPLGELPPDFDKLFPELTHLYLWNCKKFAVLPKLPDGLECLDVRGCKELTRIVHLPSALDCLVVSCCEALSQLPLTEDVKCPALRDFEFNASEAAASEKWILHLLSGAPELRELNLSGCPQRIRLTDWPLKLRRARFNGCTNLEAVPDYWPEELTRIELSGTAVEELPELLPNIDYVNLAGATKLKRLDKDWKVRAGERATPRTLFLHRSGLLMPPASEQGEGPTDNVAASTRGYFEDVELTGKGEVKRCKVLMLGNGGAGKTTLSLALQPGGDPTQADKEGSTPGLKFWDWVCDSKVAGKMSKIHRHIWDFGGQEIYHNAHRLFMSAGSVFVIVWKPEQDGKVAPVGKADYPDEWRPLRYWLDFIHLACPPQPRIIVVCSFHAERSAEIEARFRRQIEGKHEDCPLVFIDSKYRRGELQELHDWLGRAVVEVVETQGTAVPSYWEIAQNMIEAWVGRLKADVGFAVTHNEMSREQFAAELQAEIERVLRGDATGRYRKLKDAIKEGTFALTPERVRRTLAFLTHSGWLFWDAKLFGERVIVGQEWALKGIYAALERREHTVVFRTLRDKWHGQFTRKRLVEIAWGEDRYTPDQQRLLISFMERMGICFTLVTDRESLWREPLYVSLAHLKTAEQQSFAGKFFTLPDALSALRQVKAPHFHLGRWQAILAELGATYGTEADYAKDAFFLQENKEGQSVLIQATFEKSGIGGAVHLAVVGPDAAKKETELMGTIRALLDADVTPKRSQADSGKGGIAGDRTNKKTVFVSYTWQPRRPEDADLVDAPVPPDYEAPVNYIKNALKTDKAIVELMVDKDVIGEGDDVMAFMDRIKETDKVLIVHSDKYWRSPYCMFEFSQVLRSFIGRESKAQDTLVLLELPSSGIWDTKSTEPYIAFWTTKDTMPSRLKGKCTVAQLKAAVIDLLENQIPKIHAWNDLNARWNAKDQEAILAWVKRKIGLTPRTPRINE